MIVDSLENRKEQENSDFVDPSPLTYISLYLYISRVLYMPTIQPEHLLTFLPLI